MTPCERFIKNPTKVLCVVFHQDSESGLRIKIGHRQPECQRMPKLSSRANPAVVSITAVDKELPNIVPVSLVQVLYKLGHS